MDSKIKITPLINKANKRLFTEEDNLNPEGWVEAIRKIFIDEYGEEQGLKESEIYFTCFVKVSEKLIN